MDTQTGIRQCGDLHCHHCHGGNPPVKGAGTTPLHLQYRAPQRRAWLPCGCGLPDAYCPTALELRRLWLDVARPKEHAQAEYLEHFRQRAVTG